MRSVLPLIVISTLSACQTPPPAAHLLQNRSAEFSENEAHAAALRSSLIAFLEEANAGHFTDATVPPGELNAHPFFFRGLKRFPARENEAFTPPAMLKSYSFDDATYFVTVAFSGTRSGTPFLHKIVELKAVPHGGSYRFTSICRKLLRHIGARSEPLLLAPARPPPQQTLQFA